MVFGFYGLRDLFVNIAVNSIHLNLCDNGRELASQRIFHIVIGFVLEETGFHICSVSMGKRLGIRGNCIFQTFPIS